METHWSLSTTCSCIGGICEGAPGALSSGSPDPVLWFWLLFLPSADVNPKSRSVSHILKSEESQCMGESEGPGQWNPEHGCVTPLEKRGPPQRDPDGSGQMP